MFCRTDLKLFTHTRRPLFNTFYFKTFFEIKHTLLYQKRVKDISILLRKPLHTEYAITAKLHFIYKYNDWNCGLLFIDIRHPAYQDIPSIQHIHLW